MVASRLTAGGTFRVVRGCLLATSSLALTVAAHGAAGGGVPDVGLILLPTALIGWAGTALATRRRSRAGLMAVLGVSQLFMHMLLATSMPAVHDAPPSAHAAAGPVAMTIGHILATVVLGVVVAHADALLLAVATALAATWPRRPPPPPVPAWSPPGKLIVAFPPATTGIGVLLGRILPRRGPPRVS